MEQQIVISNQVELLRFGVNDIVFVKASGNYSYITAVGGHEYTFTIQVGQLGRLIEAQMQGLGAHYIHIDRSVIININYVRHIDMHKQMLEMADNQGRVYDPIHIGREALKFLKQYIEQGKIPEKK